MTWIGVDIEVPADLRGEDINESELSRKNLDTLTAPTRNYYRNVNRQYDCPVLFISVVEFLVIDGKRQQGRRLFCNFSVVRSVPNVLTIAKYCFEWLAQTRGVYARDTYLYFKRAYQKRPYVVKDLPLHSTSPSPTYPGLHLHKKWDGKLQHSAFCTHLLAMTGSSHSLISIRIQIKRTILIYYVLADYYWARRWVLRRGLYEEYKIFSRFGSAGWVWLRDKTLNVYFSIT